MYVVAGLNTGTEYYRANYQLECVWWINDNMAKHTEPLIIKKVEDEK